jgi:peroxiredoxin
VLINLKQLLQKGPVILNIYRGGWCPYCNLELKALAETLPDIQATGAQLIAIAPQLPEHSVETAQRHELKFEVISDVGKKVSRPYGLVLTVPESLRPVYKQFNLDIPGYNGDQSFELPMTATYIVKSDGVIAHAFANVDHTVRMAP